MRTAAYHLWDAAKVVLIVVVLGTFGTTALLDNGSVDSRNNAKLSIVNYALSSDCASAPLILCELTGLGSASKL